PAGVGRGSARSVVRAPVHGDRLPGAGGVPRAGATAGGHPVLTGGGAVVQHVERGEADGAADVGRGRLARARGRHRRRLVSGRDGLARLELPQVVAIVQNERLVDGDGRAGAHLVVGGQPR